MLASANTVDGRSIIVLGEHGTCWQWTVEHLLHIVWTDVWTVFGAGRKPEGDVFTVEVAQTPIGAVDSQIDLFHSRMREVLGIAKWETWIKPLSVTASEGAVGLEAPNRFNATWVSDNYIHQVREVASSVWPEPIEVTVVVTSVEPTTNDLEALGRHYQPTLGESTLNDDDHTPRDTSNLVSRYSFENFVVGPSNRFAHAAAQAVAEQPGQQYNPLFIYAGAGLGKTHLLHAVGQHRLELDQTSTVRYVTSESFFNDFINSIRRKRMGDFKSRYRKVDLLLLDDVQFFEGKEQILEEFFHTFNTLYEAGNQLVISSDRPPRELRTIEDRLRSRFEWGLTTDIQSPDVETRLAILRKNAAAVRTPVPDAVLEFIGANVSDNIRELEGALTRVTAYALLTGQPVTAEMAASVLRDVVQLQHSAPLTADGIIETVAGYYDLEIVELLGPSRRQPLARQRQVAMYVCREHTGLSLPRIGAAFGGRDHTTVMHAVDKIKGLLLEDKAIYDQVTAITQQLGTT